MNLQEKIKDDLKQSMINKDVQRKDLLRVLLGELTRVDPIRKDLTDEEVTSVIRKLVKNAKEMNNEGEIKILSEYLPTLLGEKQLETLIIGIINKNNYTMSDMGKIMGELKQNFGSTYDGKMASNLIKKILS